MIKGLFTLAVLVVLCGVGCQTPPKEEFVKLAAKAPRAYQVGLPKSGWIPVEMEGADVAMENELSQASFAIFTPSRMKKEVLPLELLSTQLFIEIKGKNIISKEYLTIGGHPPDMKGGITALKTVLEGTVEGEKVKMESYVFIRGDLVYDIIYWAHPEDFHFFRGDFQGVIESFRFIDQAANVYTADTK